MNDQTRKGFGNDSGADNGSVSFSQPSFNEAEAIASLKGALPKTQAVEEGVANATNHVANKTTDQVAEASARNTERVNSLSTLEQDLLGRLDDSIGRAQEVNEDIRRSRGPSVLDSVQNGTIRVGQQVFNMPAIIELKTRLESLSPRELEAINEVRTYEMAQTQLDKKIGEIVERTDLDPFTRELMRGEMQKTKDTMRVPQESLDILDAPRVLERGSATGGPAQQQLLEQGARSFSGSTLREYVSKIEEEYKTLEENDAFFESLRADIDPIFKEDLQRQNIENTKAGLEQLNKGAESFSEGKYLDGAANVVGGALRSLGGSIEAAWDNPEAVIEIVAETTPQMAAAFNPYTAALTNSAYVGDVYKEALNEYKKENNGKLPGEKDLSRMALASLGAGILEVAADKVLVGGTGKLKETVDPAVKAAIAGAANNKYMSNAVTRLASRVGTSAVTEGVTESGQTALEEVAKGNEVEGAEVSLSGVIGAVAGGAVAGSAQGIKETVDVTKIAANKLGDAASSARDQLSLSPEERTIRDVRKVLRKAPAKRTPEEKKEVVKAKTTLESEKARLELLRKIPGVSEEVIKAQEAKVNSMQTRGAALAEEKPDKSVFESVPEEQSVDDYLGEVAYQIGLDSEGELSSDDVQRAVNNAVARGATDAQVKDLVKIVEAKKTSQEVSDNIRIGDSDWRGGGTYLANIVAAQEAGNEGLAAYNATELMRFSDYIDTKVDAFKEAQKEAKRLGRSVKVINPIESAELGEDIPYVSLDGNDMYATGDARTDDLINTMTRDNEILGQITADALEIWTGEKTPTEVLADFVPEAATTPETEEDVDNAEEAVEEQTETAEAVDSEEEVEPQFAANTEKVAADLDEVLSGSDRNIKNSVAVSTDSDEQSSSDSEATPSEVLNLSTLPESGDVVARAANSTQSPGVKRAIRELGKQIAYKERDGVVVEPLDSTISEAHYNEALNLIKSALSDESFGKQLKTKGIGEEQLEAMPDSYFVPDSTDVDSVYRSRNEFRDEAKVKGFVADTGLTRKTVFARGIDLGLSAEKATLVAKVFEHARQFFVPMIQAQFARQMEKVKNPEYAKFNSEFASNFADQSGGMVAFMQKGMVLGMADYVMNNASEELTPTTSQVQAFGGLDSKAEVPSRLMALAFEVGVGDTKARMIENLGSNALNIAGVRFNGAHANTRGRHISAAGNIMFNALRDAGVIEGKRVSINRLVWAGAEYDNTPLIEKLRNQAVKQGFVVNFVGQWPGNRFEGKYIIYNGIVYQWQGRNYSVFEDVSQGNYIETFYIKPDAVIGGLSVVDYLANTRGASTPFSKVFGTDRIKRVPAMQTPRKNEGKIKGFPHKRLNQKQKAAQDKQSEQALYLDKGILRIKEAFGDNRIMRVAGYREFDEDTTNKVVKLSLAGKNQTIKADLDGLNQFLIDMETEAEQFNIGDIAELPFYANFFNSAYQRQFVDSQTFNYQSSKAMHRFMAHHGSKTFNFNDVGQKVAFLVSVAQGMGISADKLSSVTSIAKLDKLVEEHADVVGLMQKFERKEELTDSQMDDIVAFAAGEENMHTLLALREYARYRNALENQETSMEVVMPIELDGVNNGPITAILQSLTWDMDFNAYLRRAGITLASEDQRTSAERYEDKADGLYEEGATAVQKAMELNAQALRDTDDQAALGILRAQTVLKALKPKNVSLDGKLNINRNETKGIITKLFYNAGDASLLRAEVGDLVSNFYEELQEVINGTSSMGLERLVYTMAQASTSRNSKDRFNLSLNETQWRQEVVKTYGNLIAQLDTPEKMVNFELPLDIQSMLVDNMKEEFSFGYTKLNAIKDTYSSAMEQASVTSQLTSVGAVYARELLDRLIQEKREELGLSRFEDLPEKELEKLYSEYGNQLPNLKLDMHTAEDMSDAIPLYNYGDSPRSKEAVNRFGLKANDGNAPIYVTGQEIVDVGAGGVAASTISVADASTIFGIMEQLNEGFMTVFDGVLINGLRMDVLAQAANAAYIKSLRNNDTFAKIYENYQTVTSDDFRAWSPKFREELIAALRIESDEKVSDEEIQARLDFLSTEAFSIKEGIRKNAALGTEDLSVDQFGAVNDKTVVISKDGTVKDAFAELNPLQPDEKYYDKVESTNPMDAPIISATTNNHVLAGFINRNWSTGPSFNKRGTKTRLYNLIKQAGVENSEYAEFLRTGLIDNVLLPAFEAIGTLPRIRVVDNIEMVKEVGYASKGAFRYADNTIFLNTGRNGANVETLFHELVHAALDVALVKKGRQSKKFAEELEALGQEAKEFLEKNQSLVTRFTPDGAVTEGVNPQIPFIKKNGTVNTREFLSWSLTNYHLMTQLAQAKAESNPRGLFGRIWNFIRRVLQSFTLGGNRIQEDSIFSFLYTTAADLAQKAEAPRQGARGKSLQEDYSDINNATPEETFDNLAAISQTTTEQFQLLHDVFTREIIPLMETEKYNFLNSHANTAERLNELKDAGVDIRLDNFKGMFNMSPLEEHTFQMYRAIMAEALEANDKYAKELSELYKNAKLVIKPEDFGDNGQAKYDAVFVQHGSPKAQLDTTAAGIVHEYNRSEYLASFAALARINPEMRAALEKGYVRRPNKARRTDDIDVRLIEAGVDLFKKLAIDRYTGTKGLRNYKARAERLAKRMAVADQVGKSGLERKAEKAFQKLDYGYGLYKKAFEKGLSLLFGNVISRQLKLTASEIGSGLYQAFTNRDREGLDALHQSLSHGVLAWLPRLVEDMLPTNERNREMRRLSIGKTRAIAGARDGKTKAVKQVLRDIFKRELRDAEQAALTEVLLDADLRALMESGVLNQRDVISLLNDEQKLDETIETITDMIHAASGTYSHFHVRSAYSLGTLIGTGQPSEGFTLPNAKLISEFRHPSMEQNFDPIEVKELIDQLATLVALKHTKKNSKEVTARILEDAHVYAQLNTMLSIFRQDSIDHRYQGNENLTMKGGFNETYDTFKDLRMVGRDELTKLTASNYSLHRVVHKDDADGNPQELYLVSSSTGGLGEYQQGLYSTINAAQSGIKNLDGRTTFNGYDNYAEMQKYSKLTRVRKRAAMESMFAGTAPSLTAKELLVPVVNEAGIVTGFQYTVSRRERENILGRDKNFIDALSQSFGRTVEAEGTEKFNNQINVRLKEAYDVARIKGQTDKFIEVSKDAPTKRGREAYRMMPPNARANLKQIWGEKAYVDSQLFDVVYGYRKASIANVLRRNVEDDARSDWVKQLGRALTLNYKLEKPMVDAVLRGEKFLTEVSHTIKDLIVIRGLRVMLGNMVSNTVQLVLQEDMPLRKAIKYQIEGITEARRYQEAQAKVRRLQFEKDIESDARKAALIESRIVELQEELARNPARHLIDHGLLTAIVEDVEDDTNPFSYMNRLNNKITGMTRTLPNGARSATNALLVTKDSEVYRSLYMFTQLGDFSSRYAALKYRTEEKGEITATDIDDVVDAFVNYDLPANKYLQYLGDVGQLWFFKYFFRIQNVIIRNTIRNPRRVFELITLANITGLNVSTYFDAFFLFNSIFNKMGFFQYAEMGWESLPAVQVYDFITP